MLQLAQANPGLANVQTNYKERKPQIRVSIDRDRAADLGVSLETRRAHARDRARLAHRDDVHRSRPRVQRDPAGPRRRSARRRPISRTSACARRARDELIPLSSVVRLEETSGTMQLARFNRLRAIKISADLANGYTMGEAVQWFQDTVARELPPRRRSMWDGETRRVHAHRPAALLHVLARARGRVPRARGAVRELRASRRSSWSPCRSRCSARCSA